MSEATTIRGQFVVRSSFALTDRGTCVIGFIASGDLRADDELRLTEGDRTRRVRCRGVSRVREVPLKEPPSIGLLIDNGEPDDFVEGMTLTVYR